MEHKARESDPGFCKMTYAANLSKLVGVYTPCDITTLQRGGYMASINVSALYNVYRDKRPTVAEIDAMLQQRGTNIADKQFVSLGKLCITLFPQERTRSP